MSIRALFLWLVCLTAGVASAEVEQGIDVEVARTGDAFVIDVSFSAPVDLRTAWDVLVDFDHMTSVLPNLTSSCVLSRDGNKLVVKQAGVAKYGVFSYEFESEREIRLEPMTRILARSLSGTEKRMTSEARLSVPERGNLVQIR